MHRLSSCSLSATATDTYNVTTAPGCVLTTRGGFVVKNVRRLTMPPDVFAMERIMGVEPTTSAWEANVLPINYIRMQYNNYTTLEAVCQDL